MKKVAFLLILFTSALFVVNLSLNSSTNQSQLSSRATPPTKVIDAANDLADQMNFYPPGLEHYSKSGSNWTVLFENPLPGNTESVSFMAAFKPNGKQVYPY